MQTSKKSVPVDVLGTSLRRGIDSGEVEVPILPRIAGQILSMTDDPNTEMSEFSKLIHTDQSLASHVLRIANSAAYSTGEPVVSLQQAIARLGMKLLADIALAVSIQATKSFVAEGFEDKQKTFTRHALLSGLYGKEVARLKRRNVEGQFLCGLLHSVGKPVVLSLIVSESKKLNIVPTWERMENLIDRFYFEVGEKMTSDWKLPSLISVTSKYYKNYQEAPSFQEETAITYLTDLLATWIQNPQEVSDEQVAKNPVFIALNFYPDEIQKIMSCKERVMEVAKSMEV